MKFLVAVDAPRGSRKTGQTTRRLVQALGMKPVVCHVVPLTSLDYKHIPEFQLDMIRQQARKVGEGIVDMEVNLLAAEGVEASGKLLLGEPGGALLRELREGDYRLGVVGSRGQPEIRELLFGSISSDLVYHSEKPVLVVKQGMTDEGDDGPLRMLVAVDHSPAARRALTFLEQNAKPDGCRLTFLNVVEPGDLGLDSLSEEDRRITCEEARKESRAFLQVKAERFLQKGFTVELEVGEGEAGSTITHTYQNGAYEMLVAGRSNATELGDFVHGSVGHYVARHCPVNILLVP